MTPQTASPTSAPASTRPARTAHPARTAAALLALRIVLGVVMIAHGWQKLSGGGIAGASESFSKMGAPGAPVTGYLVVLLEFGGGVLMLLGLGTTIIGALFALNMIGAIALVHGSNGFYAASGGYEYTLVLAVLSIFIAVVGAGRYGADALIAPKLLRRSPQLATD